MKKWWTILFSVFYLLAPAQERCYTSHFESILAAQNPNFFQQQKERERLISQNFVSAPRNGPLTIPVVFHLLGKSGDEFPSDELVLSQLEVLNEDYGYQNANRDETPLEAQSVAVDMGLRFCLAQVDPEGYPSTGIIRTVTNFDCIGDLGFVRHPASGKSRLYYSSLGGSDAWDSNRYLNIWVASNCNSFIGFSSFPGEVIAEEDGVVVDPLYFGRQTQNPIGSPYDLGRTVTHEVAHYFNLRHLWGDGGCESDDGVQDTPLQEMSHLGCPIFPATSCQSPDYFFNFLDYSDDECLTMFTLGQRQRVWSSIANLRPELLRDLGCEEPGEDKNLLVYPNPARDILYFKFIAEPDIIGLTVYDVMGRIVENVKFTNGGARWIDVAGWTPGIYYYSTANEGYRGSFIVGH